MVDDICITLIIALILSFKFGMAWLESRKSQNQISN